MAQLFSLGGLSALGVAVRRLFVSESLDILCGCQFGPRFSGRAVTQRTHSQPQLGGADWPSHSAQSQLWVHEFDGEL